MTVGRCQWTKALESMKDIRSMRQVREKLLSNVYGMLMISMYYRNLAELNGLLDDHPQLQERFAQLARQNMGLAFEYIRTGKVVNRRENVV